MWKTHVVHPRFFAGGAVILFVIATRSLVMVASSAACAIGALFALRSVFHRAANRLTLASAIDVF